jgi:ribosomal protein S13
MPRSKGKKSSKGKNEKSESDTTSTEKNGEDIQADEQDSKETTKTGAETESKPNDKQKEDDDKKPESETDGESEKSDDDKDTSKDDETETKEEEKPKELTQEDIIKILKTFPGVGQVMAERIYNAGFNSREKLQELTGEGLNKIRGIGKAMSENIVSGMGKAIKDFDSPPKEEVKKEGPGITDKALGFIKGTISKITGFFKGKLPKSKSETKSEGAKGAEVGTDTKTEPGAKTGEQTGEETYPEVGAPSEESKKVQEPELVTVETTESVPEEKLPEATDKESKIEPELESKPEPKPEPEAAPHERETTPEPKPEPEPEKINLTDASGLFKWFEDTPGLRVEAGKLVFKAGYNNLDELKEAVEEDLILINGIDHKEANSICSELQKL